MFTVSTMAVVQSTAVQSESVAGSRDKLLPANMKSIGGDLRKRHSMRGYKICPSCGKINGQRAMVCSNNDCALRKELLLKHRSFDPVQLITHSVGDLYSVRSKERSIQPRNFVQITDVTLAQEENAAIVSTNAICFVDTCKYDASDNTNLSCKHVKSATEDKVPAAEVYAVAHEVLWNLNIELEQKMRLWDMYKADEQLVPAVQRLNASTFVVKCAKSKTFPAGRLHVQAMPDQASSKRGTHACACKKLKIIVEPDNSVVMQEEICDHLLLLLAAVLSKPNGKKFYSNFTNALKCFWMPASLNLPLADATQEDTLFGYSINIAGDVTHAADDIFIFDNEFLPSDDIPDFPDNILKSVVNLPESDVNVKLPATLFSDAFHPGGDPNLVSSCSLIDDTDAFNDIASAATVASADHLSDDCVVSGAHLELSDCNIELMDQFQQLTDQIDICSEAILPPESAQLFPTDSLSELVTRNTQHNNNINSFISTALPTFSLDVQSQPAAELSFQTMQRNALPPIEMPTIAVVKKERVKAASIVTAVKTRNFPYLPAKRSLISNDLQQQHKQAHFANVEAGPALAYSAWLEHVIESINESIVFEADALVKHTFHVHEEMFAHFSKSFSIGVKRRMPNSTSVVKGGKHKGLIKYIWIFSTASTVQRIFTTRNLSIQLERAFELSADGYVPYVKRPPDEKQEKYRRIYPKLALHVAYVCFECNKAQSMSGIKLEWLPNAFPKSHYGILNIAFSVAYKEPGNI